MKNVFLNNIGATILVLLFGYLGYVLLMELNMFAGLKVFEVNIWIPAISIVLGVLLRIYAGYQFTKNKVNILEMDKHSKLVMTGPFKFSRNPLYLAILLVTLGFVLLSGSWLGIIFVLIFWYVLDRVILTKEELDLEKVFGKEYIDYKNNVNRWI
ncbi:isoprenylcysteine carboxylmethyltransferase family protein [Candidatus Parcubacteria bacterium]|nr:isoprenylcysteine carboxylmethyltransferase family protein [Candidatus Parcubacteria bacterium]